MVDRNRCIADIQVGVANDSSRSNRSGQSWLRPCSKRQEVNSQVSLALVAKPQSWDKSWDKSGARRGQPGASCL